MKFDELMALYCAHQGLQDNEPNADGAYDFTYEGRLTVRFLKKMGPMFVVEALIDPNNLSPEKYDLERLMHYYLARVRISDEILTIDPDLNRLLIYLPLSLEDMDVIRLEERVASFLTSVSYWRNLLANEVV